MKPLLLTVLFAILSVGFSVKNTVTVTSTTSYNLGTVTVGYSTGSSSVSITGSGSYPVTVGGAVTYITIAGQQTTIPSTGPVLLPTGEKIDVKWFSDASIELADDTQISIPVP